MFATDTNTLVYYFKGIGNVGQRLLAAHPQDFAIPSVVLYELEVGTAHSTVRREALDAIVRVSRILPFDGAAARRAAVIRNELAKKGQRIGPLDMLIAAHALSLCVVLVTNDEREFKRVEKLKVENWV